MQKKELILFKLISVMSNNKNDDNNITRIIIVINHRHCFTKDLELINVTRAPLIIMDTTHTESIKIINYY